MESFKSDEIKDLVVALVKAQGEFKNVAKSNENPFFHSKYADLASCWDEARPVLTKYGLAVTQVGVPGPALLTLLLHTSGQWISSSLPLEPLKKDPQGLGSALTYMRRYGLQAILGQASTDDDGQQASQSHETTIQRVPVEGRFITEKQAKRLFAISKSANWPDEELRAYIHSETGATSSSAIPWTEYDRLCSFIEKHPYPTTRREASEESQLPA